MCRAIVGGAGGGEAGGGGATAAERGAKAQQQAQALGLMGCQPQLHARADNQMAERTIPHVFFLLFHYGWWPDNCLLFII